MNALSVQATINALVNRSAPTIDSHGTEFLQFPHTHLDLSRLQATRWIDGRTQCLIHDFTVYSAAAQMYCSVRLVVEAGVEHGSLLHTAHVRMVDLRGFEHFTFSFAAEVVFALFVGVMIVGEALEIVMVYRSPYRYMREHVVELRYELAYKMLHAAAFQGVLPYRPKALLDRLTHRLFHKYRYFGSTAGLDSDSMRWWASHEHVRKLNEVGERVVRLHSTYARLCSSGFSPPRPDTLLQLRDEDARRQAVAAVLHVTEAMRTLHDAKSKLDELTRASQHKWLISGSCCRNARVRLAVALHQYLNAWNIIDIVNYTLFSVTIAIRAKTLTMVPAIAEQIRALSPEGPGGEAAEFGSFVSFYSLAYLHEQTYLVNAFNAILTWLKVFKFLQVFPAMSILLMTLGRASRPLLWFMLTFIIVLIGCGQGFFIAFGPSNRVLVSAARTLNATGFTLSQH